MDIGGREEQRGSFHADQNVSIPLHVGGRVGQSHLPSNSLQVKVFSIVGTQGQGVASVQVIESSLNQVVLRVKSFLSIQSKLGLKFGPLGTFC